MKQRMTLLLLVFLMLFVFMGCTARDRAKYLRPSRKHQAPSIMQLNSNAAHQILASTDTKDFCRSLAF